MTYEFKNKPLPYDYDSLTPYIDEETMIYHHDKHLQTYVDKLNNALKNYPNLHSFTLEELLTKDLDVNPKDTKDIINNAGGVFNHFFYFDQLSKDCNQPMGELSHKITTDFGSMSSFEARIKAQAMSVFGSGFTWLVLNQNGDLDIINTSNQDTPLSGDFTPIITIDVWEHAYYLKHKNNRSAYLDDQLKLINYEIANQRYMAAK